MKNFLLLILFFYLLIHCLLIIFPKFNILSRIGNWISCILGQINSEFIYSFISIDYRCASEGKEGLDDEEKKKYIVNRNYANLFISLIIFATIYMNYNFMNNIIILFVVIIRCISRSFELIFAFGKDIMEKEREKNILLSSKERLQLAIKSYVEVIFNYSSLYYLLSIVSFKGEFFYKGTKTIINKLENGSFEVVQQNIPISLEPLDAFYQSVGISTFSGIGVDKLGLFSTLHLFTSFVLVVFAMASYLSNIGNNKEKKKEEKIENLDKRKSIKKNMNFQKFEMSKSIIRIGIGFLLITLGLFILFCWFGNAFQKDFIENVRSYAEKQKFSDWMTLFYNIVQTTTMPILTFIGAYLIYITIKNQKEDKREQELESRLYASLDFHRKNIDAISLISSNAGIIVKGRDALVEMIEVLNSIYSEITIYSLTIDDFKDDFKGKVRAITMDTIKTVFIHSYDKKTIENINDMKSEEIYNILEEEFINFDIKFDDDENFNEIFIKAGDIFGEKINRNMYNLAITKKFPDLLKISSFENCCGVKNDIGKEIFNIFYKGIKNFKSDVIEIDVINSLKGITIQTTERSMYVSKSMFPNQKGNLEIVFNNLKEIFNIIKTKGNKEEDIRLVKAQMTYQEKILIEYYCLGIEDDSLKIFLN